MTSRGLSGAKAEPRGVTQGVRLAVEIALVNDLSLSGDKDAADLLELSGADSPLHF